MDFGRPVEEWRHLLANDTAAPTNFRPRWPEEIMTLPRTAAFGRDADVRTEVQSVLHRAIALAAECGRFIDKPVVIIVALERSVLVMQLRRDRQRVDLYQLWRQSTIGSAAPARVDLRQWTLISDVGGRIERRTQKRVRADEWSAALRLTIEFASLLERANAPGDVTPEQAMQDDGMAVTQVFEHSRVPTYALLDVFNAFDIDLANEATAATKTRTLTAIVEAAASAAKFHASNAVKAGDHARRLLQSYRVDSVAYALTVGIARGWYDTVLARVRVVGTEQWMQQLVLAHTERSASSSSSWAIEASDDGRNATLLGFLRNALAVHSVFKSALPSSVYPFIMPVTPALRAVGPGGVGLAHEDTESKAGVLMIIDSTMLSFVQVGDYDGRACARRIFIDVSRSGRERLTVTLAPRDVPFARLTGAPDEDVSIMAFERAESPDAVSRLVNSGVDARALRIGAALLPLYESALQSLAIEAAYSFTDMLGVLVFVKSYLSTQGAERDELARMYAGYTRVLREFMRDLARVVYGSSMPLDDECPTQPTQPTSSVMVRTETQHRDAAHAAQPTQRIELRDELEYSRVRPRGPPRLFINDDMDADSPDEGEGEEEAEEEATKRRRQGNALDDDEVENVQRPPVHAPPAPPTECDTVGIEVHELLARSIVASVSPNTVFHLQRVSRAFARAVSEVPPQLLSGIWQRKYPLLATVLSGAGGAPTALPLLLDAQHGAGSKILLSRLYARLDELRTARRENIDTGLALERQLVSIVEQQMAGAESVAAALELDKRHERVLRQLRLYAIERDYEQAQLERLAGLLNRLEGRPLLGNGIGPVRAETRQRSNVNRVWSLMLSMVDNIAHHPRVRVALLGPGMQRDTTVSLGTFDAATVNRLVLPGGEYFWTPHMYDYNSAFGYFTSQNDLGRLTRFGGRYYVVMPRLDRPLSSSEQHAKRRSETALVHGEGWLLRKRAVPPFFISPLYTIPRVTVNLQTDDVRVSAAITQTPANTGLDDIVWREIFFRASTEWPRAGAAPSHRIVTETFWQRTLWPKSYRDAIDTISETSQSVFGNGDLLMRPDQEAQWERLGITETASVVAVDHALVVGLMDLWSEVRALSPTQGEFATVARQHARDLAGAHVWQLIDDNELDYEDADEALERIADDELETMELRESMPLLRDLIRQQETDNELTAVHVSLDARPLVPREPSPYAAVEILAQIDETMLRNFGTIDEYVNARISALLRDNGAPVAADDTTTPVRVFRRAEYYLILLLLTQFTVSAIYFTGDHPLGLQNGLDRMPPFAVVALSADVSPLMRVRLFTLRERLADELQLHLDDPIVRTLRDPQDRRRLRAELRVFGIRLEEFFADNEYV